MLNHYLRQVDFDYVRNRLRFWYQRKRRSETRQERREAKDHIKTYREFLNQNDYPDYSEIDDIHKED